MKKISKKEKLKRQKTANKLIAFSQMPYDMQLRDVETIAEI